MKFTRDEVLARLRERVDSRAAVLWVDEARWVRRGGGVVLRVMGRFQEARLKEKYAGALEEAFACPVTIVARSPRTETRPRRLRRAAPCLTGPAGEFAGRLIRAVADGVETAPQLVVVHGPAHSGTSVLLEWAFRRAGSRAFRLDVGRLRSGRGRPLVPRKPLVVADDIDVLATRPATQRTFTNLLDGVLDRGGSMLCSLGGHPRTRTDLEPALCNRLLGGVLVPIERDTVQAASTPANSVDPDKIMNRLKGAAARLFGVERALLDAATKRRTIVTARRAVMAAACRGGLSERQVAAAFGMQPRSVREACRWADREERRDVGFAGLLDGVAREFPE